MNLPNKLTVLRLIFVPVFVACFYIKYEYNCYIACAVFVVAYLTDILDGQIARRTNCVSTFGKLMDPIADKALTSAALIMLVAFGMMSPIPAIIIIAREFAISGFRLLAAGKNILISASKWGKMKTVSQCTAIALILLGNPVFSQLGFRFDLLILWISVVLTLYSGFDYIYKNRAVLRTV